jgi:hypothetical protein
VVVQTARSLLLSSTSLFTPVCIPFHRVISPTSKRISLKTDLRTVPLPLDNWQTNGTCHNTQVFDFLAEEEGWWSSLVESPKFSGQQEQLTGSAGSLALHLDPPRSAQFFRLTRGGTSQIVNSHRITPVSLGSCVLHSNSCMPTRACQFMHAFHA